MNEMNEMNEMNARNVEWLVSGGWAYMNSLGQGRPQPVFASIDFEDDIFKDENCYTEIADSVLIMLWTVMDEYPKGDARFKEFTEAIKVLGQAIIGENETTCHKTPSRYRMFLPAPCLSIIVLSSVYFVAVIEKILLSNPIEDVLTAIDSLNLLIDMLKDIQVKLDGTDFQPESDEAVKTVNKLEAIVEKFNTK